MKIWPCNSQGGAWPVYTAEQVSPLPILFWLCSPEVLFSALTLLVRPLQGRSPWRSAPPTVATLRLGLFILGRSAALSPVRHGFCPRPCSATDRAPAGPKLNNPRRSEATPGGCVSPELTAPAGPNSHRQIDSNTSGEHRQNNWKRCYKCHGFAIYFMKRQK